MADAKKQMVLVADSDEYTNAVLEKWLVEQGFNPVIVGADREKALAIAKKHAPAVVILDIDLHIEKAEGLARALKTEFSIPVLVFTAKHMTNAERCNLLDCCDGIVAKKREEAPDVNLLPAIKRVVKTMAA